MKTVINFNTGAKTMKIATHNEIENKAAMVRHKIAAGENVCTWSVQDDMYSDDIYNGTFKQVKTAAKALYAAGKDISGIALMSLDSDLCVDFCHKAISLDELFDTKEEYERATVAHEKMHNRN